MTKSKYEQNKETLDPEDWDAMRALGHRMIGDLLDQLAGLKHRPAWQHAPETIKKHLDASIPLHPQNPEKIYQEYLEFFQPYLIVREVLRLGNEHLMVSS